MFQFTIVNPSNKYVIYQSVYIKIQKYSNTLIICHILYSYFLDSNVVNQARSTYMDKCHLNFIICICQYWHTIFVTWCSNMCSEIYSRLYHGVTQQYTLHSIPCNQFQQDQFTIS